MPSKYHSKFFLWFSFCILSLPLYFFISQNVHFNNSIISLLPATQQDPLVAKGVKHFGKKVSSHSLFLISHQDFSKAAAAADKFVHELKQDTSFENTFYKAEDNSSKQWHDIIFPHRYHILTEANRKLLEEDPEKFLKDRIRKLYSPLSPLYTPNLEKDPLMLFGDFMQELPVTGNVTVKEGYLTIESGGRYYIMISTQFRAEVFDRQAQEQIRLTLDKAIAAAEDAEFLQSSFFPFAERGRLQAEWEITFIGGGSSLGIALLFLFIFRSFRQLIMTFVSIGSGILWGLMVTQIVFGQIHLFTLVFGGSLIGVCVDYSFHYFAKRIYKGKDWHSYDGLRAILPGISLGALTSILAYGGLLAADFPGLQQLACFACTGLTVSFLIVILYFPIFFKKPHHKELKHYGWVNYYAQLWSQTSRKKTNAIIALVLVIAGIGLWLHKTDDDIRLLQGRPADLVAEQRQVQRILKGVDRGRFLLIKADSINELLSREERVSSELDKMKEQDTLKDYLCLTKICPSEEKQIRNQQLLLDKITEKNLAAYGAELGFEKEILEKCLSDIKSSKPLSLEEFLKSPAGSSSKGLYMGKIDEKYMSIILLEGIKDSASLMNLQEASYVNHLLSISNTLSKYRLKATWITAIAYFFILFILFLKFGITKAWKIILPPVLAALLSCACITFLGIPLNLFNILSLLIVLGVGIDYSIFFALSTGDHQATGMAIILSAMSTILAFGLLSLSATAAVKTFGLTLLFGIVFSVIFAPLAKSR